jgi:hypothetical protein
MYQRNFKMKHSTCNLAKAYSTFLQQRRGLPFTIKAVTVLFFSTSLLAFAHIISLETKTPPYRLVCVCVCRRSLLTPFGHDTTMMI